MHKYLKLGLIGVAAFLGVAGLGAWYAISTIDPAKLTQLLSTSVKEATGRDLKIHGPVSLKIFPSIGITAQQVSFSNATWAKHPDMLKVQNLQLDIELLPLFSKQVAINSISLSGVEAHLQTNKAGDGNWNLALPVPGTSSSASTGTVDVGPNQIDPVKIKNLMISDAQVTYQDFGSPIKQGVIPKFTIGGDSSKTQFDGQAQYLNYQLGLKGKTSNLRQAFNDWDQKPVKLDLQMNLTLNGKTMDIQGLIHKLPQKMPQFDIKLSSKSFDLVPLAGGAVVAAGGVKSAAPAPQKSQGRYFFSEDPIPFDLLPAANGTVALNIAELSFPGHVPMTNVNGVFKFDGSKIDIAPLSFGLGKGSATVQAAFSQVHSANPVVAMKGIAKDFTLEQLMDAVDSSTKVKGGNTEIAFNFRGVGSSMHQLASNANGAIQVQVGKGSLDSRFIDRGGDLLITIADAVNPVRKKTDQTLLECAVFYLPVNKGIVNINNSIGAVTDRLDVVLSGTVNLSTEALDIKIDPREKSGLTTGVNLAGLVKLQGTLLKPQAGVNKEGVVNSAVSIGLGILTGGATLLAENAKSLATKSEPCKAALHSWSDIYPGAN